MGDPRGASADYPETLRRDPGHLKALLWRAYRAAKIAVVTGQVKVLVMGDCPFAH